MNKDTPFPLGWDQWRTQWLAWKDAHTGPGGLLPAHKDVRFPGKNFMADEILGVWKLPSGRHVELSEVTFPDLTKPPTRTDYKRFVGITFMVNGITEAGDVVDTFAALEHALGLA